MNTDSIYHNLRLEIYRTSAALDLAEMQLERARLQNLESGPIVRAKSAVKTASVALTLANEALEDHLECPRCKAINAIQVDRLSITGHWCAQCPCNDIVGFGITADAAIAQYKERSGPSEGTG